MTKTRAVSVITVRPIPDQRCSPDGSSAHMLRSCVGFSDRIREQSYFVCTGYFCKLAGVLCPVYFLQRVLVFLILCRCSFFFGAGAVFKWVVFLTFRRNVLLPFIG